MTRPALYTEQHEWARLDDDNVATVGITIYAAEQLGDIVYAEFPEIGEFVKRNEEAAVVESVKAASEIYAPISGEIVAVNDALHETPELVNEDPEGEGWFIKIRATSPDETQTLMTKDAYQAYLKSQEESD